MQLTKLAAGPGGFSSCRSNRGPGILMALSVVTGRRPPDMTAQAANLWRSADADCRRAAGRAAHGYRAATRLVELRPMIDSFKSKYGLQVNELDPDAGSGDEVEAIKANQGNLGPQAPDVIDVGFAFGPQAKQDGLVAAV